MLRVGVFLLQRRHPLVLPRPGDEPVVEEPRRVQEQERGDHEKGDAHGPKGSGTKSARPTVTMSTWHRPMESRGASSATQSRCVMQRYPRLSTRAAPSGILQ